MAVGSGPYRCRGHFQNTLRHGKSSDECCSLSRDLYGFAIELRQLAYTMPGGYENPLVRLSERMIHHAQEEATLD